MDASCGPSNALTNLSKHAQRDTHLQNEASQRMGGPRHPNQLFRSSNFNQVDANLNQEFERFQGRHTSDVPLSSPYAQQQRLPYQPQHQHQRPLQNQHQQSANPKWVQDFSQINLGASKSSQGDWQSQFMRQSQNQAALQSQSQGQMQTNNFMQLLHLQRPTFVPTLAREGPFQLSMRTDLSVPLTEHRELHLVELDQESFNQQFDAIERELENETVDDRDTGKDEFARTAQQVRNSMMSVPDGETSSKFQQSNFLKLMSDISNKSVELDGDKFVNAELRADIRELTTSPQSHSNATESPANVAAESVPATFDFRGPVESDHVMQPTSALPDPMAHIKDGALDGITDPLMAAKIISGNQVTDQHWLNMDNNDDDWLDMTEDAPVSRPGSIMNARDQEIYDDYRHDDDYR